MLTLRKYNYKHWVEKLKERKHQSLQPLTIEVQRPDRPLTTSLVVFVISGPCRNLGRVEPRPQALFTFFWHCCAIISVEGVLPKQQSLQPLTIEVHRPNRPLTTSLVVFVISGPFARFAFWSRPILKYSNIILPRSNVSSSGLCAWIQINPRAGQWKASKRIHITRKLW